MSLSQLLINLGKTVDLGGLKRYWPTIDETGSYTGPFSTFAEYHSAAMGLGAAATCDVGLMTLVAAYAVGQGANRKRHSEHWRDLVKEPAYALGAIGIGRWLFCEASLALPI